MRLPLLLAFLTSAAHLCHAQLPLPQPTPAPDLRCNDQLNPLAVEGQQPRFTWLGIPTDIPGVTQTRVLLATDAHALAHKTHLSWQSTWAVRPAFSLTYDGPSLSSDATYFWTVESRSPGIKHTIQRTPATFHTAAGPWSAHWIQAPWSTERDGAELDGSHPMPVFRREFTVRAHPVEATLRIAGLGQYQAQLNGDAAFDQGGLNQAWTDYRKTVTYDTYSAIALLKPGLNVISVLLGNGMYNAQHTAGRYTKFEGSFGSPKLIAELRIRYTDGTTDRIDTDATWQAAHGPIQFSSPYGGEDFDARHWPTNWDRPGPTGPEWQPASLTGSPGGTLRAALAPAVTVHGVYLPVSQHALSPTRTVYDIGQNLAGWPAITVQGSPGSVLRVRGGELLNPDGTVSQASTGHPQWWTYTLGGGPEEHWTPRFSFWGYRYLQADWVAPTFSSKPSEPEAADAAHRGTIRAITSQALSSDSPVTGSFTSSSELLNRIHALITWATHNNEQSLFTDCPHREKLGWLEETHLVAPGMLFNNDLAGLYAATEQNIADAQDAQGMVPTIAPQYTKFGPKYPIYDDSPEWGSAAILAPWTVYRFNGDLAPLRANYAVMQRYLTYLQSRAEDGIVAYGLGDWYDIGPGGPGFEKNTTLGVTGTLMLYEDATVMARIADLLGRSDEATRYRTLADTERSAFQRRFWNPKLRIYDTGSQTANAMPLALSIVPPEDREAVLDHVIADIHAHNDHITTGEVGFPYLVRLLLETGHSDLLLAIASRKDPPSYGSQIAAGATALTEAWDANPKSSQDHLMLGGLEEWFYRGLGGIDIDLSRPDPAEWITLRPQLSPGLHSVNVTYNSALGNVALAWTQNATGKDFTVTVPAGAQATLYLPARPQDTVQQKTQAAAQRPQAQLLQRGAGTMKFRLAPGTHSFHVSSAPR